jgi:hypothetical protein
MGGDHEVHSTGRLAGSLKGSAGLGVMVGCLQRTRADVKTGQPGLDGRVKTGRGKLGGAKALFGGDDR